MGVTTEHSSFGLQRLCSIMPTCNAANSSQFHRLDSGEEVLVGVLEEEELLQLNIQQLEYK